jgi:hypothetical protein
MARLVECDRLAGKVDMRFSLQVGDMPPILGETRTGVPAFPVR